jgi:tryptophanase
MSNETRSNTVRFASGENIPLELHKVRVVQKLFLHPVEHRLKAMRAAGFNTFQLSTSDVFLDMLTDSGTNAMSDNQISAMLRADDAYAGSQSFARMQAAVEETLGTEYVLPVHQGRAAENIISRAFIKQGDAIPMNYHFTTTKAHMELNGGKLFEIYTDEALKIRSECPFKGNLDIEKLQALIKRYTPAHIPFIRLEASTNLIGGQPFSIDNMRQVRRIADEHGIMIVLDASLIGENAYFVKQREKEFMNTSIKDILRTMCGLADLVYFSSRKVSSTRGGAICTNRKDLYLKVRDLVVLFEGFVTYGGMSVREIEALAVGMQETTDETVISQSPSFIAYLANKLDQRGIPVILPPGALGCHIDCMGFLPHVPQSQYPAGAMAAALFIASGARGMERGTISSVRDDQGNDVLSDMELLRLAFPRRVFTLSQTEYVLDRITWLHQNRDLVGGLRFVDEPSVLRFFMGRLEAVSDWPEKLVAKFRADFGDSL